MPPHVLSPGQQVGKYQLRKKLGQGGFGLVYAAHDATLDREVALKFLRSEHAASPVIVKRFLQEARSAAKIVHPGIVTVYECGEVLGTNTEVDGTAFIAMELLEGESLTDRLARSGQLHPTTVLELGRQLASAVDAAHRAGIVHRDLKPDNILLVRDPAIHTGERVKVLDFGIAKLGSTTTTSPSLQTQSMMVFGTPLYMSPEQCRSAASVDHRSDIYTLGCILFELLCGKPPFDGQPGELIAYHLLMPPPSVVELVPDAPELLGELIARMLAKDPADRPQSMAVVQRVLEACGAVVPGEPDTLPPGAGADGKTATLDTLVQLHPMTLVPAAPVDRSVDRPAGAPAEANPPTTLSALAGSEVVGGGRSRVNLAVYIAAAVLVILIPIVVILAMRSDPPQLATRDERPLATRQGVRDVERPASAQAESEIAATTRHGDEPARSSDTPRSGAPSTGSAASPSSPTPSPSSPTASSPSPTPSPATTPSTSIASATPMPGTEVHRNDGSASVASTDGRRDDGRRNDGAASTSSDGGSNDGHRSSRHRDSTADSSDPLKRGILAVASRPATEIYVDGRSRGFGTQHVLDLTAGRHRVVLLSNEHGIRDTFAIEIVQGETAKVTKEYKTAPPPPPTTTPGKDLGRDSTINPFARSSP